MFKHVEYSPNEVKIVYTLNQDEIDYLKELHHNTYKEYRNNDMPKKYNDLLYEEFIEYNELSWHPTIVLSKYGIEFLRVNNYFGE